MSHFNRKHGATSGGKRTKEYRAWKSIKDRCYLTTCASYRNYGARGIAMFEAWRISFSAFLAGIGLSPSPKHTVERIDNDGNYEPGNVTWKTAFDQARNRRTNVFAVHDGVKKCAKDWAAEIGIPHYTILRKLNVGMTIQEIVDDRIRRMERSKRRKQLIAAKKERTRRERESKISIAVRILDLAKIGVPQADIARMFDVNPSEVSRIKSGERYKIIQPRKIERALTTIVKSPKSSNG